MNWCSFFKILIITRSTADLTKWCLQSWGLSFIESSLHYLPITKILFNPCMHLKESILLLYYIFMYIHTKRERHLCIYTYEFSYITLLFAKLKSLLLINVLFWLRLFIIYKFSMSGFFWVIGLLLNIWIYWKLICVFDSEKWWLLNKSCTADFEQNAHKVYIIKIEVNSTPRIK